MKKRGVNVLDNMFDRINMLLWPRFKAVFDNNLKSLRTAATKKLGSVELHAHYISRRYAEFVSTMLTLVKDIEAGERGEAAKSPKAERLPLSRGVSDGDTTDGRFGGNEMLRNDLVNVRSVMVKLLGQLSGQHRSNKSKIIFLINNFDAITCVLRERKVSGDEISFYEDRLNQQREQYVEEELRLSYGRLISFVQETEGSQKSGDKRPVDAAIVEGLVRNFSSSWKAGIEKINSSVLSHFSNFRNGMEILKQVLTQLLLYYTRFQGIIKATWKRPQGFMKDIVPTTAILAEIKKYALALNG